MKGFSLKTWIPCELHTHTLHSDGSLELIDLAGKAGKLGLECIALTDHNTIAGHREIAAVEKATGINIIPGLEWTTFYGHMVAMGVESYVDWRDKGPADIQKGINEIHMAGGLAGVAHPYRMGSPMCTGCYWQFELEAWNSIDYFEVWSENFPALNPTNKKAFELWSRLIDQGYRLTAVSGRDWHGSGNEREHIAVTYLGIDEESYLDNNKGYNKALLKALKNGHVCVTMGPLLKLAVKTSADDIESITGEDAWIVDSSDEVEARVELDFSVREGKWQLDVQPLTIVFTSNCGILKEISIQKDCCEVRVNISVKSLKWLRTELYGSIAGCNSLIAFTNPIYFRHI